MPTSPYNGNRIHGIFQSRREIIAGLLLHGTLSRKRLAEELGVTFPAVANHVNEMLKDSLVEISQRVLNGANRPTQEIALNDNYARTGIVTLEAGGSSLAVVSMAGKILELLSFPTSERTQNCIAECFSRALEEADRRNLKTVTVGIDGLISPKHRIVFALNGVPKWEACLLVTLCPRQRERITLNCCSKIWALTRGWGRKLKNLDRIGVFSWDRQHLGFGVAARGQCKYGSNGTAGDFAHLSVQNGRECYCGRKDCFLAGLHAGSGGGEFLCQGIQKIAERTGLLKTALIASDCSEKIMMKFGLEPMPDAEQCYLQGLALQGAEQAWLHCLCDLYAADCDVEMFE